MAKSLLILSLFILGNVCYSMEQQEDIFAATAHNNISRVQELLGGGVDVNNRTISEDFLNTPLHIAALYGYIDIARLLIAQGANVNALSRLNNECPNSPNKFSSSAQSPFVSILLAPIVAYSKFMYSVDEYFFPCQRCGTPLHYTVRNCIIGISDRVVYRKKDLGPMLHRNMEIARLLLDRGANVNAQGFKNRTPLHDAAESGYFDIARLLIERGADISSQDNEGKTPAQIACPAMARYLNLIPQALQAAEILTQAQARTYCLTPLEGNGSPIPETNLLEIRNRLADLRIRNKATALDPELQQELIRQAEEFTHSTP